MIASTAGTIRTGMDGRFYYVDEEGNERRVCLWIQGTELHMADVGLKNKYSIEGEFASIHQVPTKAIKP